MSLPVNCFYAFMMVLIVTHACFDKNVQTRVVFTIFIVFSGWKGYYFWCLIWHILILSSKICKIHLPVTRLHALMLVLKYYQVCCDDEISKQGWYCHRDQKDEIRGPLGSSFDLRRCIFANWIFSERIYLSRVRVYHSFCLQGIKKWNFVFDVSWLNKGWNLVFKVFRYRSE